MLALVDGDIIKYSCGFAAQRSVYTNEAGSQIEIRQVKGGLRAVHIKSGQTKDFPSVYSKAKVLADLGGVWTERVIAEPEEYVCSTVKRMIHHICKRSGATQYQLFLSRGDCFRVGVYPEYKANRKDIPKPVHTKTIEEYMERHHPCIVSTEIEADDAMGIMQYQSAMRGFSTIICTKDKDLDMIPGWHYSWQDHQITHIDEQGALRNFWLQTLTGDRTDNIPGLAGVGAKTAEKILADVPAEQTKETILKEYETRAGWGEAEFERNARLLWILRKPLADTYGKTYREFFK